MHKEYTPKSLENQRPLKDQQAYAQSYRESAWRVFIKRAERLEKRAMGYRAIAHLVKHGRLTEAEEETVWTVGAFDE